MLRAYLVPRYICPTGPSVPGLLCSDAPITVYTSLLRRLFSLYYTHITSLYAGPDIIIVSFIRHPMKTIDGQFFLSARSKWPSLINNTLGISTIQEPHYTIHLHYSKEPILHYSYSSPLQNLSRNDFSISNTKNRSPPASPLRNIEFPTLQHLYISLCLLYTQIH